MRGWCCFFLLFLFKITKGFRGDSFIRRSQKQKNHLPAFRGSVYVGRYRGIPSRCRPLLHRLQSQKSYLENQREELKDMLNRIDQAKKNLIKLDSEFDLSKSRHAINDLCDERNVTLVDFVPPVGLSSEQYVAAMLLYLELPPSIRYALARSLNMEGKAAGDYQAIPDIVAMLYEKQTGHTQEVLPNSSDKISRNFEAIVQNSIISPSTETNITTEVESTFRTFYGSVARNTKTSPSSEDVSTIMKILQDEKLVSNCIPFEVPGVYIIPGIERKVDAEKLLNTIDSNVPRDWECSVSLVYNFIDTSSLEPLQKPGCALLVWKNSFSAENPWLYYLSTVSALATSLMFSSTIFGRNQMIDLSSTDDFVALIQSSSQFLLPLLFIVLSQEMGQFFSSKKEDINSRFIFPTLLPSPGGLPLLGSLTRIRSSPRNMTSLFDFAIFRVGVGFVSSLSFMLLGLFLASQVDGQGVSGDVLPSLSVGVLKLSTFGASLVDYINGGDGFITSQESETTVPLHPVFIAGFCGMMINAIDMIPVGATNGGRMSLAVFGRQGHAVISGLAWLALLVASFVLEDDRGRVLSGALLVNSLAQNDMEIPCRDETDEVDSKRLVLFFSLWFFAALVIVPM